MRLCTVQPSWPQTPPSSHCELASGGRWIKAPIRSETALERRRVLVLPTRLVHDMPAFRRRSMRPAIVNPEIPKVSVIFPQWLDVAGG
jgi:hypothetical protein